MRRAAAMSCTLSRPLRHIRDRRFSDTMSIQYGLWKTIGLQLRRPSGAAGRLIGHAMALINREPNRIAIDALKIEPEDTVLELGFGPGRAIRTLASMVPLGQVLGIDQSTAMFDQASLYNRRAIRSGRVQLEHGRFDALPWGSDSVDKILAVNVVYFFHTDADPLREARRVLRPGGLMAIYATDKSTMAGWPFCTPETHRIFDHNDLMAFILSSGFTAQEVFLSSIRLAFRVSGLLAICRKGDSHRRIEA
jgi:SAM-dependent methyltransferase